MVLKNSNQLGSVWTNYTLEFSFGVWACVVALVVVGAFVYFDYWVPVITNWHPEETLRMKGGEAFMITLGALTAQSEEYEMMNLRLNNTLILIFTIS